MANFPPGQQQQKVSPNSIFYQFTPEETQVMKECNRESFYQRSLPLSLILGAGSFMCVRAGFFKPSVKWGPWPKVVAGGLFGYIVGKYSYQTVCAEKLMQLPNSEIGRMLRERKGKKKSEGFEGNVLVPTITSGADVSSFSTDYKSDIDIDMHKPMNSLDMDYRPDYDASKATTDIPLPSSYTNITYDELRARNRQEYDRTLPNKPIYRPPPPSNTQPIWDNQPYPTPEHFKNPQPRESRNQYGDIFN